MQTPQAEAPPSWRQRGEAWIARLDRPLLALALVSIVLYLLDLRGLFTTPQARSLFHLSVLVMDLIFVVDLLLKISVLRGPYLRSPWALIDGISCIPILALIPAFTSPLLGLHFIRGFRIFRVLRGLRILRLLRAIPAFQQYQEKVQGKSETQKQFERALSFGVLGFSVIFVLTIWEVRHQVETEYIAQKQALLNHKHTLATLPLIDGSLTRPKTLDPIVLYAKIEGRRRAVYFAREPLIAEANLIEFYLVFGSLVGIFLLIYLLIYQLRDVSYSQIRGILNIVLPHQVASQFLARPDSYSDKHRMPGSILFLDITGFTRACESLGDDLETLSRHLEQVMDAVTHELVGHDLIIDKFIGDAIMCFAGGPLCPGSREDHAHRMVRGALAAGDVLEQLDDPYFGKMKIGGASTDACLIGAFGTSTRLSYTVLGDGVNLAARLEAASGACKTRNLFCHDTYDLLASRPDLRWRQWGSIRVKGKRKPLKVYEAFDASALQNDGAFIEHFHQALAAFEQREFAAALEGFTRARDARPGGDPPSDGYIEWCHELLEREPPEAWLPVLQARK